MADEADSAFKAFQFLPLLETSVTGMKLHQSRLIWPTCDDGRDTDPERDSAGFVMLLQQIPADKALTPLKKNTLRCHLNDSSNRYLAITPTEEVANERVPADLGAERLHELVFWRRIYRICQHVRSKWIRRACSHKLGLFNWVNDEQHSTCCIYSTEVLSPEAAL